MQSIFRVGGRSICKHRPPPDVLPRNKSGVRWRLTA